MILADTSIWVDHLGRGDQTLASYLTTAQIVMHPFVLGEIAMGSLPQRGLTLLRLGTLRQLPIMEEGAVLRLIDSERLFGTGIGWVDAHLLAATKSVEGTTLWSRDRRLRSAADRLAIAFDASAE